MSQHRIVIEEEPEKVLDGVREAAEIWNAGWERGGDGGRLALPVVAGLRRGWVVGRLTALALPAASESSSCGPSTELFFAEEESDYRLNLPALLILLVSGFASIIVVIWPFFGEKLLTVAPLAGLLVIAGWFLVVSRLTSQSCDNFLELVRDILDSEDET